MTGVHASYMKGKEGPEARRGLVVVEDVDGRAMSEELQSRLKSSGQD
jgi:hypothetical protein